MAIILESSLYSSILIVHYVNPHHHVCFKAEKVKDFQRLDEVFNRFNDLILKKAYTLPASSECLNPCRCSDLGKKSCYYYFPQVARWPLEKGMLVVI